MGHWGGNQLGFYPQARPKCVLFQRRNLGFRSRERLFWNLIREGRELFLHLLLGLTRRLLFAIAAGHIAERLRRLALLRRQGFGILLARCRLLLLLASCDLSLILGRQDLISLQVLFRIHMVNGVVLRILASALLTRGFRHVLGPGESYRKGKTR